jgi:hypothetical protein
VVLNIDSKTEIALSKNPVFQEQSKHIELRYHFIRQCIEDRKIQIEFMCTEAQLADVLTKALARVKFHEHRAKIGMKEIEKAHKH